MRDYIEMYMNYLRDDKKAPLNTLVSYERDLRKYLIYFENSVGNCTEGTSARVVEGYMRELEENGMSASSVIRAVSAVRSMYKYLLRSNLAPVDPSAGVALPKKQKKSAGVLSEEDVSLLLSCSCLSGGRQLRDRAMFMLLYSTGIQVSQLLSLNCEDVDLKTEVVRVMSLKKVERLALDKNTVVALAEYIIKARPRLAASSNELALFVNSSGGRMSRQGFWKLIKSDGAAVGIKADITPQALRTVFKNTRIYKPE